MSIKKNKMFCEDDCTEIKEAVKAVERVSSGEIVPVIVSSSSTYRTIEVYFSLFFSLFFCNLLLLVFSTSTIELFHSLNLFIALYTALVLFGFILGSYIFKIKKIRSLLIPKHFKEAKVEQAARNSFFANGIYKTKNKTGILIYISLFERSVVVIGDEGINSKLQQSDWDNVVNLIIQGIKDSKIKDGIVAGINSCAKMLAKYFPVEAGDVNELKDDIVIE